MSVSHDQLHCNEKFTHQSKGKKEKIYQKKITKDSRHYEEEFEETSRI